MSISEKIKEEINKTVKDDELKQELLNGEVEAIKKLGIISSRGIDSKEIVKLMKIII